MSDTTSYKKSGLKILHTASRYSALFFILFLLGVYAILAWRVVYFTQMDPDPSAVSAQVKSAGVPKVDPEVVKKIEQLKDNSVSVQTLFEQARSSPFKE